MCTYIMCDTILYMSIIKSYDKRKLTNNVIKNLFIFLKYIFIKYQLNIKKKIIINVQYKLLMVIIVIPLYPLFS